MTVPSVSSSFARAVMTLLLAIFLFDVMGAIIKHLGARYPTPQLSAFRNLFGLIPSVLALYYSREWHRLGRPVILTRWRLGLLRGGFVVLAQFCFYLSLVHLEFATATTIAFAGPMFITALSVPVLKFKVGVARWCAVLLGFSGVVMVMQPTSDAFSWYALLPLGAAFGYACIGISARLFDEAVPTALISVYSHVGAVLGSTFLMVATSGYTPIDTHTDLLALLVMGIAGGIAVFFLVGAYRMTEPSNLSPFEYFGIPFSFMIGWVVFNEAPIDRLVPGVFFVLLGGLLIVWRERVLQRATTG